MTLDVLGYLSRYVRVISDVICLRDFGCLRLSSGYVRVTLDVFGYVQDVFVYAADFFGLLLDMFAWLWISSVTFGMCPCPCNFGCFLIYLGYVCVTSDDYDYFEICYRDFEYLRLSWVYSLIVSICSICRSCSLVRVFLQYEFYFDMTCLPMSYLLVFGMIFFRPKYIMKNETCEMKTEKWKYFIATAAFKYT